MSGTQYDLLTSVYHRDTPKISDVFNNFCEWILDTGTKKCVVLDPQGKALRQGDDKSSWAKTALKVGLIVFSVGAFPLIAIIYRVCFRSAHLAASRVTMQQQRRREPVSADEGARAVERNRALEEQVRRMRAEILRARAPKASDGAGAATKKKLGDCEIAQRAAAVLGKFSRYFGSEVKDLPLPMEALLTCLPKEFVPPHATLGTNDAQNRENFPLACCVMLTEFLTGDSGSFNREMMLRAFDRFTITFEYTVGGYQSSTQHHLCNTLHRLGYFGQFKESSAGSSYYLNVHSTNKQNILEMFEEVVERIEHKVQENETAKTSLEKFGAAMVDPVHRLMEFAGWATDTDVRGQLRGVLGEVFDIREATLPAALRPYKDTLGSMLLICYVHLQASRERLSKEMTPVGNHEFKAFLEDSFKEFAEIDEAIWVEVMAYMSTHTSHVVGMTGEGANRRFYIRDIVAACEFSAKAVEQLKTLLDNTAGAYQRMVAAIQEIRGSVDTTPLLALMNYIHQNDKISEAAVLGRLILAIGGNLGLSLQALRANFPGLPIEMAQRTELFSILLMYFIFYVDTQSCLRTEKGADRGAFERMFFVDIKRAYQYTIEQMPALKDVFDETMYGHMMVMIVKEAKDSLGLFVEYNDLMEGETVTSSAPARMIQVRLAHPRTIQGYYASQLEALKHNDGNHNLALPWVPEVTVDDDDERVQAGAAAQETAAQRSGPRVMNLDAVLALTGTAPPVTGDGSELSLLSLVPVGGASSSGHPRVVPQAAAATIEVVDEIGGDHG